MNLLQRLWQRLFPPAPVWHEPGPETIVPAETEPAAEPAPRLPVTREDLERIRAILDADDERHPPAGWAATMPPDMTMPAELDALLPGRRH